MQNLPVYLYTNLFEVILDLDNNTGIHQIMYQRPIIIQKGVSNTIQLQFKNSDQKRVNVSTQTFVINVFDEVERKLVMTKDVTILDNASTTTNVLKGIGQVVFTEHDTENVDAKSYKFSIIKVENNSWTPVYSDTYYGVSGTVEVRNDVYPAVRPSLALSEFQRNFNADSDKRWWEWYSGNLKTAPTNSFMHTTAFYLTRFKGKVIVEGSLENTPGYYGNYATITTKTFNGFTGVSYANFTGMFTNIRVRYIPDKNPVDLLNTDPAFTGTFDKLLYRC
jgi:hypothetical protein